MFTIEQIKNAHSKVKSGADFPKYIKELQSLGVTGYDYFVSNGKSEYFGNDNYRIFGEPKYDTLEIASTVNSEQFKKDVKAHQKGETDFITFCNDCAKSGIVKWTISIHDLTCTYYDHQNNSVLMEAIPV